jgi:3-oxoadipate enol-lactonase
MEPEPMALFCKDDRSIHYLERGRGEPLLLIHGLGSSGADWALQVAALEGRFRVIVPDLPGSGHSAPLPDGPSIPEFAASLWELLDHLRVARVNIVGFSLGGAVGLEMSLQRSVQVRRLALINSLASYRLDHWRKWLEASLTLILVPLLGMRRAARLAAKRLFPMPWQSNLRARASAVVSAVPARTYLESARALIGWTALDRLDRLSSKTLVIAAELDYTPLDEKRALAARLGAQFVVVRGSRHGTPFDAVQATNATLLALLTDHPLPPAEHRVCDQTEQLSPLSLAGTVAEEHAMQMMRRFDAGQAAI